MAQHHPHPSLPESLDQWPGMQGRTLVGEWFSIDPKRQQDFYTGTYLDQTYGPSIGEMYPEGIVEGFHQLGLLDYLVAELVGRWHGYNYGLDQVRFLRTLTIDERIRIRLLVSEVQPRGEGYRVTYEVTMEVEHAQKPCMVAQWIVLLLPLGN